MSAVASHRSAPFSRTRHWVRGSLQMTSFAVMLGVALTVYTTFGLLNNSSKPAIILPVAIVVAGALAFVAIHDIETFVLVALAMRSSLDALKLGTPGGGADPAALLGLFFLGLGVVWLMNRRSQVGEAYPTSRLGTAMVIFTATAMLGIATSADALVSVIEWSRIASIVVLFLVVEQLAARSRASASVIGAICCAVPVPFAVALSQLTSGKGLFEAGGFSRITGTFTHSNPLAYFCAAVTVALVALLPFVRGWHRLGLLAVLGMTLPLLLLTYTRSAWLAAFAGIVVMTMHHNKKLLLGLGAAILAVVVLVPSVGARFSDLETTQQSSGQPGNSLSWRLAYWQEALQLSEASPITGVGLKAVASTTDEGKQPHNDFVRAYVELGVPGLLAYLWMLLQMARTSVLALRTSRGRGPRSIERGVALASVGVVTVVLVLSTVANLMSQVVVMWYAVGVVALASGTMMRRQRLERAKAEAEVPADPEVPAEASEALTVPAGKDG